jgi:uncharacterized membrane protein
MRSIIGYFKPLIWCWMLVHFFSVPAVFAAENTTSADNPAQVMEAFTKADNERSKRDERDISDHRKQQIMFIMGIALLIFIVITVSLGVAMVVFAKPVFVAHMIFAGFSLTLAVAHAIVAIVWFFPK